MDSTARRRTAAASGSCWRSTGSIGCSTPNRCVARAPRIDPNQEMTMALPKKIVIHELGPREGMQIEKNPVSTAEKVRLIDLLSECNFPEIEVVSFVSPK